MTTLVHLSSRKERNSFDYKHSSFGHLAMANWLQFAFCISGVLVEAFFGKKKNFSQK